MIYFSLKSIRVRVAMVAILVGTLAIAHTAMGETMSSPNYRVESDSMNFGGSYGSSSSYKIEDTLGESATGLSSSTNYTMKAGYQQMQSSFLSVTPASDVIMSPSIGGVTGGTSNGNTQFTVLTDNPAGYTVTIKASSSPAMTSPESSIADYVPAGANPDFTFTVAPTASALGYTVEGGDVVQAFKDDGTSCNTGSANTPNACWRGLSTSDVLIVNKTSATEVSGQITTLKFRVEVGSQKVQPAGVYVATTTVTVLPL